VAVASRLRNAVGHARKSPCLPPTFCPVSLYERRVVPTRTETCQWPPMPKRLRLRRGGGAAIIHLHTNPAARSDRRQNRVLWAVSPYTLNRDSAHRCIWAVASSRLIRVHPLFIRNFANEMALSWLHLTTIDAINRDITGGQAFCSMRSATSAASVVPRMDHRHAALAPATDSTRDPGDVELQSL